MSEQQPFHQYLKSIENKLINDDATEHTHRPALAALVENLSSGISATNEPKRIECGAPDYVIRKGSITIGYIEAKDIGINLDTIEKSEQLQRYRKSLSNLILTDYLEFRWYVDGEKRLTARLGTVSNNGIIRQDKDGIQATAELLTMFLEHKIEQAGTPQELAKRMARLAHMIRDLIIEAFKLEEEIGSLHNQLAAFQNNLIPDLSPESFADMYAQTITYGLFAARCTAPLNQDFTRQNAAYLLPKTNPFLRKLFNTIAGPELDDRIAWLVDDLAQILAHADMEAILKNFGKHSGKEDPVVHFYETFLTAYDPKVREMRGVYYTPEPVVSYIVRSIDYLLKTRFNKPQGLADENTLILDPATGTATFLYMVIREIHQSFAGQEGMWNDYVAEKLLKRIFGFELLMAPYAVAHLKLGLLLQETGYQFQSDERLGVYLTNTLDEAIKHSDALFAQWISEEANAAAEIKKEKPIMVVLGNPPYSGHSANKGEWAKQLVQRYYAIDGKPLGEKNPKWLQDDYVKFLAFGQWRIEQTGQGVLGFITNHGYLDNPTFRGMRQSLMNTFTDIYILNLHGNSKKKEVTSDGGKDENVFDIQQGVAICLLVKEPEKTSLATVHYADLWGLREGKYQILSELNIGTTEWSELTPASPYYFLVMRDETNLAEYMKGWKVTDIFTFTGEGFTSHRDDFAVDFNHEEMNKRLKKLVEDSDSDEIIRDNFNLQDTGTWKISYARKALRNDKDLGNVIQPCLYRPFDMRFCLLHSSVMDRPRMQTQSQMMKPNLAISTTRSVEITGGFSHVLCVSQVMDRHAVSIKEINYLFPLYLYPAEGEMQFDGGKRRPNLNPEFIKEAVKKLNMEFIEDGRGDMEKTFGPEAIFNYAYAVFHSPTYRTRYAEFLKIDFPRLPLTSDKALFKALAEKGAELVSLHLMESPVLANLITKYPVTGSNEVEKITYDESARRVYINKTQYFEGVPPEVWEFHIGGYQVCEKWLKDRKGRTLTYDELTHYQKVVVGLKETIPLMEEIEETIPGWPVE
ncbi:MAG: N-6 DNA methylase [Dehalococcoidales bacterium]|nr:N-6 DNA methylase [Dehalococcoidales bacterium]